MNQRSFLPELQESFGDDDDENDESFTSTSSSSLTATTPRSSPWSSCSSLALVGSLPAPQQEPQTQPPHQRPHHESSSSTLLTAAAAAISVLVVGATSANGHEIIRQLAQHPSRPRIHAFVDESFGGVDAATSTGGGVGLPKELQDLCTSIVEGSIRHAIDIEEAIATTGVNWVLLCGEPLLDDDDHRHRSRTIAAKNLMTALNNPHPDVSHEIKVMIVSRIGTKRCQLTRSPPAVCRGLVSAALFLLPSLLGSERQDIADCNGQEAALDMLLGTRRLTIIRSTKVVPSTSSSEDKIYPMRKLVQLTPSSIATLPGSTRYTQRSDLASCVVDELCGGGRSRRIGQMIHIASLT